jgi:hypothetical protein
VPSPRCARVVLFGLKAVDEEAGVS